MPELDSIRGLAILLVFIFHAFGSELRPALFTGMAKRFMQLTMMGWTGVNLFFVLSGFLITGILLNSRAKPHYWSRFYKRRALRILPAYYLLLLLLPIAALIPTMPLKVGWQFVGFAAVYLANVSELFGVQLEYGPLWSLAVEEHFYIFWPWVVRWVSERGIAITAVGVIVLSPLMRAFTFSLGGAWNGSVRTWNSLDGLAMGALLVVMARNETHGRTSTRRIALGSAILGMGLFILGMPHGIVTESSSDMIGKALRTTTVNLFALSVVAFVLMVGTSNYKRFVNLKSLEFLGFISYGFYLIHVLALHTYDALVGRPAPSIGTLTLRAIIVFVLSVGICWTSRVTFEQWFLDRKEASVREPKELTAVAS